MSDVEARLGRTPEERFWSKVAEEGDCWVWTASKFPDGYGRFYAGPHSIRSHRWAYESLVAPIPEGLVLDHLCRNPPCVNPSHLEPVTYGVNTLRGLSAEGIRARAKARTHCPNGHEFTEENTRIKDDGRGEYRSCRACDRESQARPGACPDCGKAMRADSVLPHRKRIHGARLKETA